MSASERDFSNFYLGDSVYELASGVVPEIAERLDVTVSREPHSAELQEIMTKVGQNKVLRQNEEITAIDRRTMAELLEVSGVQRALRRSLWTPDLDASASNIDAVVMLGGVANWQDRTAKVISKGRKYKDTPIYLLGGSRVMDTPTEVTNPNIAAFHETFRRYPTEARYIASVIAPRLKRVGHQVMVNTYDIKNGDEILWKLFEENGHLFFARLALARVANAGIPMAVQMRDAGRSGFKHFDTNPKKPQTFVITDEFPVSKTEKQDSNATKYQKAATGVRQLVLTAKKLHEAAGGE